MRKCETGGCGRVLRGIRCMKSTQDRQIHKQEYADEAEGECMLTRSNAILLALVSAPLAH
jgi:hypothetical protein